MRTRNRVSSAFFLFTLLWCLLWLTGCTTTWVSEAINIINLLVPAITSALGILTAFGVGLPANTLTAVDSWANQATSGLQEVGSLISQYNTAEATAQPGLLQEIQSALSVIVANLTTILPEIHVTDASTQEKILAVIQAIQAEMQSLINVIPAIQGKVTSADEMKALMAAVKSPKEFKKEFNQLVEPFGTSYQI